MNTENDKVSKLEEEQLDNVQGGILTLIGGLLGVLGVSTGIALSKYFYFDRKGEESSQKQSKK